ncbi:MAG: hypothetical protein ACKVU4_12320 [Phycisphaerales bacterium]
MSQLCLRTLCLLVMFNSTYVELSCAHRPRPDAPTNLGPPPAYTAIAESWNARVATVDRLWARSVVRIWFPDREGEEQVEQVEGTFQFARPNRLLMTYKKLSETYAVLGSNAERYWWIELGEEKVAWVGEHAKAAAGHADDAGIPVRPADLIELLGVLPLPEGAPPVRPVVAWSADGAGVTLTVASASPDRRPVASVRYGLDRDTFLPRSIELLDGDGAPLITAALTKYEPVVLKGGAKGGPIATLIEASLDAGERRLKLWLHDPANSGGRPRDDAFDFDAVIRHYRVDEVRSLDDPPRDPR